MVRMPEPHGGFLLSMGHLPGVVRTYGAFPPPAALPAYSVGDVFFSFAGDVFDLNRVLRMSQRAEDTTRIEPHVAIRARPGYRADRPWRRFEAVLLLVAALGIDGACGSAIGRTEIHRQHMNGWPVLRS